MEKLPLNVAEVYINLWRRVAVIVRKDGSYRVVLPSKDRENCDLVGFYPEIGRTLSVHLDSGLKLPAGRLVGVAVVDHIVGGTLDFEPLPLSRRGPELEELLEAIDEDATEEEAEPADGDEPTMDLVFEPDPGLAITEAPDGVSEHLEIRTKLPGMDAEDLTRTLRCLPKAILDGYRRSHFGVKVMSPLVAGGCGEIVFPLYTRSGGPRRLPAKSLADPEFFTAFCAVVMRICLKMRIGKLNDAREICRRLSDAIAEEMGI